MPSVDRKAMSEERCVCIIGTGTIGLSFVALHLTSHQSIINIYDNRPDLKQHIDRLLPGYLPAGFEYLPRLKLASSLQEAVSSTTVIHECLPEKAELKQSVWEEVEGHVAADALLWSATSGIPASVQSERMKDKSRVCVVHPYNPPHVMPLLEVVPSPATDQQVVKRTLTFWRDLGREPVVIHKETTGFVANRLAFALLREAVHLVASGVVGVEELDRIVQSSMGPRWAVAGPFKSYHAGGGKDGLAGFMKNIGGTVGDVWDDLGCPKADGNWQQGVCARAQSAYDVVDTAERDRVTRRVLQAVQSEAAVEMGKAELQAQLLT